MRISQLVVTLLVCIVQCVRPIKHQTLVGRSKFSGAVQNSTSPVDSMDNVLTPLVRMKREPPAIIIHRIKKRRPKPPRLRRPPPKPKPVYGPPSAPSYSPINNYSPHIIDNNFNDYTSGVYDGGSSSSGGKDLLGGFDNLAVGEFHELGSSFSNAPSYSSGQSFAEPPSVEFSSYGQPANSYGGGSSGQIGGFVSQSNVGSQQYQSPSISDYAPPTQAAPPHISYSQPTQPVYSHPPQPPPQPPPQIYSHPSQPQQPPQVYSHPPQSPPQPPPQVYSHPLPTSNYQVPSSYDPPPSAPPPPPPTQPKYQPPQPSPTHYDFGSQNPFSQSVVPTSTYETNFAPNKHQFAEPPSPSPSPSPSPPAPSYRPQKPPASTNPFPLELDTQDPYKTAVSSYDVPINYNPPQPKPTQPRPSFPPTDNEPKGSSNNRYFPPQLPVQYDQSQFNTPLRANPSSASRKPAFDNDDFTSLSNFYNDVQETQKVNVKTRAKSSGSSAFTSLTFGKGRSKKRTTPAPIESEETSSEEEYDYFFPSSTTTTTKRPKRKKRPRFTSTTAHILDADELRDAFGQSSNLKAVSVAPPRGTFESKRKRPLRQKHVPVSVHRSTPRNFVLLSAANTAPPPPQPPDHGGVRDQETYETYRISHAAPGHDRDSATSYNTFNTFVRAVVPAVSPSTTTTAAPSTQRPYQRRNNDTNDISIISIQKSQSHSYYAGTVSEPEINHSNNLGFLSRQDNMTPSDAENLVPSAEDGDFGMRTKRIRPPYRPHNGRVATTTTTTTPSSSSIKYVSYYDDAESFYADTKVDKYDPGHKSEDDDQSEDDDNDYAAEEQKQINQEVLKALANHRF